MKRHLFDPARDPIPPCDVELDAGGSR